MPQAEAKIPEINQDLEPGVDYVLSLPEEVRHVLGIPEESVLASCVHQKENTSTELSRQLGLLVPCIWGMHFFLVEILGPEARWQKREN